MSPFFGGSATTNDGRFFFVLSGFFASSFFLFVILRERPSKAEGRSLAPQAKKAAVEINRLSLLSTENASSHVPRLTEVLRVE